jgi:hypothetical protein
MDFKAELHNAAVEASERLDAERQKLTEISEPGARRAQALRIQAAAIEAQRCLDALFHSEPSNYRTG